MIWPTKTDNSEIRIIGGTALRLAKLLVFGRVQFATCALAVTMAFTSATGAKAFSVNESAPVPVEKPALDQQGNVIVTATLASGLSAIDAGNFDEARRILSDLTSSPIDHQILAWSLANAPTANLPLDELMALAAKFAEWPGQTTIRANIERAIYRQNPAPERVLQIFVAQPPETMAGRIAQARALLRLNRLEDAGKAAREIWLDPDLDNRTAAVFDAEFGRFLTPDAHLMRMKKLLYKERISRALAASRKAGAESLYQAWVQTIRAPARALTAIDQIDDTFKNDPTVTYLKVRRMRHLEKATEAVELLQSMPKDDESLVDPDTWWTEQRIISRDLYEHGAVEDAYLVAAAHQAGDPKIAAEAEFHAGWYALRGLNEPLLARTHFQSLMQHAGTNDAKARAFYWLARSHVAEKSVTADEQATALYEQASHFSTSYYGQLAAATLGKPMSEFIEPIISTEDYNRHYANPVVTAIVRLREINKDQRADLFARELARQADKPSEIALLAKEATDRGDHRLALQIGRIGHARGLDVATLAFPLGALPADANISGAGLALTYAIARQESAFHIAAVSPANARGLLQLLPGTARSVASRHQMAYSPQRLTTDAAYNATLGAHYLGEQIDRFDGSYVLTFIAYNAGPKRVSQWIERFGDPRNKPLEEVVDWVEKIPFPETRDYVQRVLENYQIYKMQLNQSANIAADLRFGRNN